MNVSQTLLNHFCPNSSSCYAFLLAISRAVVDAVQNSVRLGKQAANPAALRHHLLIKNWQASLTNRAVWKIPIILHFGGSTGAYLPWKNKIYVLQILDLGWKVNICICLELVAWVCYVHLWKIVAHPTVNMTESQAPLREAQEQAVSVDKVYHWHTHTEQRHAGKTHSWAMASKSEIISQAKGLQLCRLLWCGYMDRRWKWMASRCKDIKGGIWDKRGNSWSKEEAL